ncbi:MAG: aminopeptidase [Bacteroidetes bacterium]|nr:aminopeptidase [Bacteroidota bacterium]
MRKKSLLHLLSLACLFLFLGNIQIQAQEATEKEDAKTPVFTTVNQVKTTSVKSQGSTGTCWCFATTSMLESELIRLGKGEIGLSEMFAVRTVYVDKAEQYVRFHGSCNFAQGGAQHDVLLAWSKYGAVPREAYPGLNYGSKTHNHGEIQAVLAGVTQSVIKNRNGKLSTVWKKGFSGILGAYFGDYPTNFTYEGKSYTPKSFAREMGINPDDYIELSSYTHHPFYEEFVLEVPDNWAQQSMYNVPIDELMEIVDYSLEQGISISWAADVSGLNFASGVALIPEKGEKASNLMANEKVITQKDRQYMYDGFQLTDDHAMHVIGTAKDQNGKKYYMEKNSWGPGGKHNGFSYMSESFMRMRTMSIMVHKDGVPSNIARKLGLK